MAQVTSVIVLSLTLRLTVPTLVIIFLATEFDPSSSRCSFDLLFSNSRICCRDTVIVSSPLLGFVTSLALCSRQLGLFLCEFLLVSLCAILVCLGLVFGCLLCLRDEKSGGRLFLCSECE